jgi:hypothetical protein
MPPLLDANPHARYFNPITLKAAGYTGQTSTGETSGTQAVDFSSTGHDYFPTGSSQRAWLDAYATGVQRFVKRAVDVSSSHILSYNRVVRPPLQLASGINLRHHAVEQKIPAT